VNGHSSPVKPRNQRQQREERHDLQSRVRQLEDETKTQKTRIDQIIRENFESVDEQTRKIFETSQAQHFQERKEKDEKIRKLEHQIEEARTKLEIRVQQLKKENADLLQRNHHLERDLESKLQFVEQQSTEQDHERGQQDDKIKRLESALDKLRTDKRVSKKENKNIQVQTEPHGPIPNFPGYHEFKIFSQKHSNLVNSLHVHVDSC